MAIALLILHGLVAVALLGAITHQAISAWVPAGSGPRSFVGRFRGVHAAAFTNAIVVLYVASILLGAVIYLFFKVDIQPSLERDRHWHVLGFFERWETLFWDGHSREKDCTDAKTKSITVAARSQGGFCGHRTGLSASLLG